MYVRSRNPYVHWIIGSLVFLVVVFLVYNLRTILTPFIAAAILAYILNPLVNKLTRGKIGRGLAAMLVTLLAISVVVSLILFIIPMMVQQAEAAWQRLPDMVNYVQHRLLPWINQTFHTHLSLNGQVITQYVAQNSEEIRSGLSKVMPFLANKSTSLILMAANLFLSPLLLYYFLVDWPRWADGTRGRGAAGGTGTGRETQVLHHIDHPAGVDQAHGELFQVDGDRREVGLGADGGEGLAVDLLTIADVIDHSGLPAARRSPAWSISRDCANRQPNPARPCSRR